MLKAFWVMVNVKTGQLTLGGQFDAYKRGQLGRNIHPYEIQGQHYGNVHCIMKKSLL